MKGLMIVAFLLSMVVLTVVVPYVSIAMVNAALRHELITPKTRSALGFSAVGILIVVAVIAQWN